MRNIFTSICFWQKTPGNPSYLALWCLPITKSVCIHLNDTCPQPATGHSWLDRCLIKVKATVLWVSKQWGGVITSTPATQGSELTLDFRAPLLIYSLTPPLCVSRVIPFSWSWSMGMVLFSTPTSIRIAGKAGMTTVMCVALQIAGPAKTSLINATSASLGQPQVMFWLFPCITWSTKHSWLHSQSVFRKAIHELECHSVEHLIIMLTKKMELY